MIHNENELDTRIFRSIEPKFYIKNLKKNNLPTKLIFAPPETTRVTLLLVLFTATTVEEAGVALTVGVIAAALLP